jgi:uncharacterized protein (TIGR04552 family)
VGFAPHEPDDEARLWAIHRRALDYIDHHFEDLPLNAAVREPEDVRDLFVLASRRGPARKDACTLLKVMHVVHHVSGRELLFRLPVAINELFHRIETRVFSAVDGMKSGGVRLAEFSGSRKTPDSVLTKLLCRTDSLAAEVYDRLRFRVVTDTLDDLFGALVYLTRWLLPFNYVVPGQSRNDLVDLLATIQADPQLAELAPLLQQVRTDEKVRGRVNKFSATGFRMINFVVDLPVRIDDLVAQAPDFNPVNDGVVVFLMVEFQLVDRVTDVANNHGENDHQLYKDRQHVKVIERLLGRTI